MPSAAEQIHSYQTAKLSNNLQMNLHNTLILSVSSVNIHNLNISNKAISVLINVSTKTF